MPPAMLDLTPDFNPATAAPAPSNGPSSSAATTPAPARRTLLLAPPSIAAREDRLGELFAVHPRSSTDLQMLDRLAAGLVTLPPATYDLVLVLTDPDGSRRAEAAALLRDRAVWSRLAPAIRPGGLLRCEDGSLAAGDAPSGLEAAVREAVLAGLVAGAEGFTKPEYAEEEVVPLRLGLKKKKKEEEEGDGSGGSSAGVNGAAAQAGAKSSAGPAAGAVTVSVDGKKEELAAAAATTAAPAGVGFVDFSDDLDLDADDDDNVIDEETLLTEEDLRRPIQQPPECRPQPGKKRRACKDCTCGLAKRMEERRAKADEDLNTLKLKSEDLNELDFTVPGKTGSCGSCYLGDAFRCSDCPYIGLPAFKPGEEVKILNNVAQL